MSVSRRAFLCSLVASTVTARCAAAEEVGRRRSRPQKSSGRPNIIVIMADDMGFSDIGCFGSEIRTPHIDSLAADGMTFTQFYNCARCCPSRASLLTGMDNHVAGVGDMIDELGPENYEGYLNDRCVTIAEALAGTGYRRLMVGKWHVGERAGHWPVDRGFERYFGLISGANSYFKLDPGRQMALENKPWKPETDGFYMTDAFTSRAVEMIDEYGRKDDPYFLYLAYTAPHWPLHAHPQDIARYKGRYDGGWDQLRVERHRRQHESGIADAHWALTKRDSAVPPWTDVTDREEESRRMEVYAAQIDRMDQGIGRVLAKVKELGQQEDTLVLFLSDNGACHEVVNRGRPGAVTGTPDSFVSYGRGWANASNTPFRLFKHWVHEGGIATPMLARWPKTIREGSTNRKPAHIVDIMPTVLELAGAGYPESYRGKPLQPLTGRSLLPALRGENVEERGPMFWEHEGNRAVRIGRWKLVTRFPDSWELYDLEQDRCETNNLAAAHPERVQAMAGVYAAWAKRMKIVPGDEVLRDIRERARLAPSPMGE